MSDIRRWLRGRLALASALLAIGLVVTLTACGGGGGKGSAAERQELEDVVRQLVATGPADIDFFLDHVTDDVLENFFGSTREECRANAEECVGEAGMVESISNTKVSGNKGETDVSADFGGFHVTLVREDDTWKIDAIEGIAQEIPEGVKAIDLELDEMEFVFDESEITDGNFAFEVRNVGDQPHEASVLRVPADLDVLAALQSEEEPEGVEFIASTGPVSPGDDSAVVFDEVLTAGRYALICFLPDTDDPERTPHVFKGMLGEFTIQ